MRCRFYYVDERGEDGSPMSHVTASAHAEEFYKMATRLDQGPWEYTFAAGKGYMDFEGRIGTIPDLSFLEEGEAQSVTKPSS